jgi:hypothetical protein
MAINSCNQQQIQRIETQETLGNLLAMGMFPALEPFSLADLWSEIQKQRGESATDEVDLRWPEWVVFRDPNPSPRDSDELFLEAGVVPPAFRGLVTKVVLARKLLEVRALVGFTRLDPMGIGTDEAFAAPVAPISRKERDWLPAIEVRGEGLFIELDSGAVARWEERPAVHARMRAMAQKYAQWQAERGTKPPSPFPGAGYVLLHSLAHVLMRQLCLDCGYSASSVRERIYSSSAQSRGMAGLLIYTATPDSEGSLGGLVDLGRGQRFPELVLSALRGAARCSSDPLCADHDPDAHATINGAACHACLLASESSCETFNRFLDRNVLVPTMADSSMAFFEGVGL